MYKQKYKTIEKDGECYFAAGYEANGVFIKTCFVHRIGVDGLIHQAEPTATHCWCGVKVHSRKDLLDRDYLYYSWCWNCPDYNLL